MQERRTKLPLLRWVTREVRRCNDAFDGPAPVSLKIFHETFQWRVAVCDSSDDPNEAKGCEPLPGDGRPIDAVAVARRLLAAWRDAGYR